MANITIKELIQIKMLNNLVKQAEDEKMLIDETVQEEINDDIAEEVINGRTSDFELEDLFEEEITEGIIKKKEKDNLITLNYYIGAS